MDNNRNTESEGRSNVSYLGDEELLNLFERYVEYIRVTLGVYSRVFQGMKIADEIEFRINRPAEQYGRYAISVSYRGQDLGMPVSESEISDGTTEDFDRVMFRNLVLSSQYAKYVLRDAALGNFLEDFIETCGGFQKAFVESPLFEFFCSWKNFLDEAKNEARSAQAAISGGSDMQLINAYDNIRFEVSAVEDKNGRYETGIVMYVRLDEQKEAVPYYMMVDAGCAFMPQQQAEEKMITVFIAGSQHLYGIYEGTAEGSYTQEERAFALLVASAMKNIVKILRESSIQVG